MSWIVLLLAPFGCSSASCPDGFLRNNAGSCVEVDPLDHEADTAAEAPPEETDTIDTDTELASCAQSGVAAYLEGTATSWDEVSTALEAVHSGVVVVCAGVHEVSVETYGTFTVVGEDGATATTLDARGAGAVLRHASGELTLEGVTLTGGIGDLRSNGNRYGGALMGEDAADLELDGVVVEGNQADGGGGVAFNGTCTMVEVTIRDNEALWGGGLWIEGALIAYDVSVEDNTALHSGGGAALYDAGSVSGGTFHRNAAEYGGGLILYGEGSAVRDSMVEENVAGTTGGGVYAHYDASLRAVDLLGNEATYGGGAYAEVGELTLEDCRVDGNEATYGGGVYVNDEGSLLSDYSVWGDNSPADVRAGGTNYSYVGDEYFTCDGDGC